MLCTLVLGAVLTGCSGGLLYWQAGWQISDYVDDYIDLNRAQEREFDRRLDDLLQWHRRTQLTDYAEFLRGLSRDLDGPVSPQQVEQHADSLWRFWTIVMHEALPDMHYLLASLSDEQVDEFLDNLEDERRREAEKLADRERGERIEERAASMERFLSRWLDSLRDEQQALVQRWAEETHTAAGATLRQRRRWQSAMRTALAERDRAELFRERLTTLFVQPQDLWSESYRERMAANRARTMRFLAALSESVSAEQRRHLREKLEDFARQSDELSRR